MADVEALDALGRILEFQRLPERRKLASNRRIARDLQVEPLFGIRHSHLQPARPIAADLAADRHFTPHSLAQLRLEQDFILDRRIENNLAGHIAAQVVLRDERIENLWLVDLARNFRKMVAAADNGAIAYEQNRYAVNRAIRRETDDVEVLVRRSRDELPGLDLLEPRDLVPETGCLLVVLLRRGLLHALDKRIDNTLVTALEKGDGRIDVRGVLLL